MPMATGIRTNEVMETFWTICTINVSSPVNAGVWVRPAPAIAHRYRNATTAPAVASHFSCSRSTP